MWLFDVTKNVMSSTGQKKKYGGIPKRSKGHKAKVTVTFLKEQNIQVLAQSPYSPDLAPCDFSLFLLIGEDLAGTGRKVSYIHFRTEQMQLHPTIKMPLNLDTDNWNGVCEEEESTLKECECCR